MGLDNYPQEYPCRREQTAVLTAEDQIDCKATQAVGGCPWQRAMEGSDHGTPILGLFGTDCWYRGKVGTFMIQRLLEAGYDDVPLGMDAFYGEDCELSREHCVKLSGWMKDHAEAYAQLVDGNKSEIDTYRYAAWWLGWVAEAGDGAVAWY